MFMINNDKMFFLFQLKLLDESLRRLKKGKIKQKADAEERPKIQLIEEFFQVVDLKQLFEDCAKFTDFNELGFNLSVSEFLEKLNSDFMALAKKANIFLYYQDDEAHKAFFEKYKNISKDFVTAEFIYNLIGESISAMAFLASAKLNLITELEIKRRFHHYLC